MTVPTHAAPRTRRAAGILCAVGRSHLVAAALFLGAAIAPMASAQEELVESGTVQIEQVQIAWIGSGNLGGGTLDFGGRKYKFSVGGLGVGGFGISKMTATGTVYNLKELRFFPGAYVQARYGYAAGDVSGGVLWLKNSNGVVLRLNAQRRGLATSLGADAVYINFE